MMAAEGLRMHTLGSKHKSVENHQLLIGSDASSGSDVQEFNLPPKRPNQPRFRPRRRRDSVTGRPSSSLQPSDIHGCCLVLFILVFVAVVIATGWLCYVTVELQSQLTALRQQGEHMSQDVKLLQLAGNETSHYVNSSVAQFYVNSTRHSLRMKKMERRQGFLQHKLEKLKNVSRLVADLQALVNEMHHSTDQAMQGLATVNNEIKVLQSDLAEVSSSLGPLPDLKDTPANGAQGMRKSIHYLMGNHTWVVSQIAQVQNSLLAAREAFDQKDVDLVGVRQRLSALEGSSLSLTGTVKKHHYNITQLKGSLATLDDLIHLSSLAINVSVGNESRLHLPPALAGMGLSTNGTLIDAILALSETTSRHHVHLTHDKALLEEMNDSMDGVNMSLASLQRQFDQFSLMDLASDVASPTAAPSRGDGDNARSGRGCCNVTLEGLMRTANYTSILEQLTSLVTAALPPGGIDAIISQVFQSLGNMTTSTSLANAPGSEMRSVLSQMFQSLGNMTASSKPADMAQAMHSYADLFHRAAHVLVAPTGRITTPSSPSPPPPGVPQTTANFVTVTTTGDVEAMSVPEVQTLPATDTTQPDTAQPDAMQSDTTQPDTTQPEAMQPDTTQPDTTQPDTTQPDTTQPEQVGIQTTASPGTKTTASPGTKTELEKVETTLATVNMATELGKGDVETSALEEVDAETSMSPLDVATEFGKTETVAASSMPLSAVSDPAAVGVANNSSLTPAISPSSEAPALASAKSTSPFTESRVSSSLTGLSNLSQTLNSNHVPPTTPAWIENSTNISANSSGPVTTIPVLLTGMVTGEVLSTTVASDKAPAKQTDTDSLAVEDSLLDSLLQATPDPSGETPASIAASTSSAGPTMSPPVSPPAVAERRRSLGHMGQSSRVSRRGRGLPAPGVHHRGNSRHGRRRQQSRK